MTLCLALIEGESVKKEDLRISLANAKQLILDSGFGFGTILHIAATTPEDLRKALIDFAKVKNVTGVVTLMIRTQ